MAVAVVFASALAFVAPPVHVAGPQFACATAQQPAALQMNLLGRAVKIPGSVVSSVRTMFKNAGSALSSSGGVSDTAPSVSAPAIEIELSKITTTTKSGVPQYPTAAEIEEFCRRKPDGPIQSPAVTLTPSFCAILQGP
jgi:hypothetical protein